MAIRLQHQPSGAAVGMAAYTAGLGKARQRQKKDALDMWREEREAQRRSGNIYRNATSSSRTRQVGQQQGTWEDPLALAVAGAEDAKASDTDAFGQPVPGMEDQRESSIKKAVQIKAQRKANERALRMGKPIPYPEAEMQPKPAPTEAEVRRRQQLEDRKEGREYQQQQGALKRKQSVEDDELDLWRDQDETTAAEIERIRKSSGGAFQDTPGDNVTQRWTQMKNDLKLLRENEGYSDAEKHKLATQMRRKFLREFNEEQHIVPWADRPGSRRTVNGEIWEKSRDPNKPDEFIDFADEPGLTDEDIRAGKSNRFRYFGGALHQKTRGRQGTEWKPMGKGGQGETTSEGEQTSNRRKERVAAAKIIAAELGYSEKSENWKKSQKAKINEILDRELPYPRMRPGGQEGRNILRDILGPQSSQQPGGQEPNGDQADSRMGPPQFTPGLPQGGELGQEDPYAGLPFGAADDPLGQPDLPQPQSQADVSKLPPGSQFIAPDGTRRRTPAGTNAEEPTRTSLGPSGGSGTYGYGKPKPGSPGAMLTAYDKSRKPWDPPGVYQSVFTGLHPDEAWNIILAGKADPNKFQDPDFQDKYARATMMYDKKYIDAARPDPSKQRGAQKSKGRKSTTDSVFGEILEKEYERRKALGRR